MKGPAEAPLVVLDRIGKSYGGGAPVLEDFSLTVGRAEFVSLLGPSGCGKSTVLRLLAGLGQANSGEIRWGDNSQGPETRGPETRGPETGFVFQDPTLMPWASVFDNVYLPLRLRHVSRREAEGPVMEALARVKLQDQAAAYPRSLSGGMKMRVSVARALLTAPRLLLMDEPFAALDEITRYELIEDLSDLWRGQDWTVVFVTHSVFESVALSQKVVVMTSQPGRVFAEIPIETPFPRGEAFRGTADYAQHCAQVSASLRQASQAGGRR